MAMPMEIEMKVIEPNTTMKTDDGMNWLVVEPEYRNVYTNANHSAVERRLTGYFCRMVRKDGTVTKGVAIIEPTALMPI